MVQRADALQLQPGLTNAQPLCFMQPLDEEYLQANLSTRLCDGPLSGMSAVETILQQADQDCTSSMDCCTHELHGLFLNHERIR